MSRLIFVVSISLGLILADTSNTYAQLFRNRLGGFSSGNSVGNSQYTAPMYRPNAQYAPNYQWQFTQAQSMQMQRQLVNGSGYQQLVDLQPLAPQCACVNQNQTAVARPTQMQAATQQPPMRLVYDPSTGRSYYLQGAAIASTQPTTATQQATAYQPATTSDTKSVLNRNSESAADLSLQLESGTTTAADDSTPGVQAASGSQPVMPAVSNAAPTADTSNIFSELSLENTTPESSSSSPVQPATFNGPITAEPTKEPASIELPAIGSQIEPSVPAAPAAETNSTSGSQSVLELGD